MLFLCLQFPCGFFGWQNRGAFHRRSWVSAFLDLADMGRRLGWGRSLFLCTHERLAHGICIFPFPLCLAFGFAFFFLACCTKRLSSFFFFAPVFIPEGLRATTAMPGSGRRRRVDAGRWEGKYQKVVLIKGSRAALDGWER